MTKRRNKVIISILIISWMIIGCGISNKTEKSDKFTSYLNKGYIIANVKNLTSLDGCGFLLVKENNEMLQPINLADSLKTDHLKLWIRFENADYAGTCMAGKIIRITDIKLYTKNKN